MVTALLIAVGSSPLRAHDGPEHAIERINAEIEKSGPTLWLLYSRAMEYRALRNYAQSEADLAAADKLNPGNWTVQSQWIQVLAKLGKHAEAALRAEALVRDIPNNGSPFINAQILALNGQIYTEQERWSEAVALFDQAVAVRSDITFLVLRSRALSHLPKRRKEQLQGLRLAWQSTQSPVILRELCDVLLRANDDSSESELAEASEIIEREVGINRLRSAWLIRRAILDVRRGRASLIEADLRTALAELAPRIDRGFPDSELLVQRGMANLLLGDVAQARADLNRAERRGAPDWILAPLIESLGDRIAPTVVSPDE